MDVVWRNHDNQTEVSFPICGFDMCSIGLHVFNIGFMVEIFMLDSFLNALLSTLVSLLLFYFSTYITPFGYSLFLGF